MKSSLSSLFSDVSPVHFYGRVASVQGMLVEITGPLHEIAIGSRLTIEATGTMQTDSLVEVVGFRSNRALALSFDSIEGIRLGAKAWLQARDAVLMPCNKWLGRVINALGQPVDQKGDLPSGDLPCPLRVKAPAASLRNRVGDPVDLGVRVINSFAPLCEGQRMGLFAGSGVGKSVLMSMLARHTKTDIAVIGLIGERGRELKEFIEDDLGEAGLSRSVIIVATSDESALMRRQAAYTAMTVAEYFRRQGQNVLLMMDSLTRFAMAQREIGLSAGEPPTSKGYTPTVFAELPALLERAGPGLPGIFFVLFPSESPRNFVVEIGIEKMSTKFACFGYLNLSR